MVSREECVRIAEKFKELGYSAESMYSTSYNLCKVIAKKGDRELYINISRYNTARILYRDAFSIPSLPTTMLSFDLPPGIGITDVLLNRIEEENKLEIRVEFLLLDVVSPEYLIQDLRNLKLI